MLADKQFSAWAERQFEQTDQGLTYRRNGNGAAFVVNAAQRDRYIESIHKSAAHMQIFVIAFLMLWVVAQLAIASMIDRSVGPFPALAILGIGLIGAFAYSLATVMRARLILEQSFSHSKPVSPALPITEARKRLISKKSYGEILFPPLLMLAVAISNLRHPEPFYGFQLLLWIFAGLTAVIAIIQSYRKWQGRAQ